MEVVFFIYGLAFFLLGFAILIYPSKGSYYDLSKSIKLIAYFGILHGINEWLDLFILIDLLSDPFPLEIIRMATLPVSFTFLIHFGSKVLTSNSSKPNVCRVITLTLGMIWVAVFLFGPRTMLMWDIWSRYILCIPGAFLTGLALLIYIPQIEPAHIKRVTQNLKIAGFAFMAYAIFAGAIVQKASFFPTTVLNYDAFIDLFGIPVQVLRSVCAVIMAYSIVRVLELFHWEIKRNLHDSQLRFNTIARQAPVILFTTDKDLNVTFIEGKGLAGLGLSEKNIVGTSINNIFVNSKEVINSCRSALRKNDSMSTINIQSSVLQVFCAPLSYRDHVNGVIGVAIDITAETKTRTELDDYRDRLLKQKTLAEIGTISTEMVQKLSLPVASIKASLLTALVALRKIPGNINLREPLQNSLDQSSKAMDIIDKFFSFANIVPNPKAQPIDIEQIINRVLAVFRDRTNQAMLRIETSGIDVVPCMFIPLHEIEQVFFGILQNVINAADGIGLADFSIKCNLTGEKLELLFSDNFNSIPYADPNDIFEPFSSSEGVPITNSFGLVVLKRLVLAYDGAITAKKQSGITSIKITLPVQNL